MIALNRVKTKRINNKRTIHKKEMQQISFRSDEDSYGKICDIKTNVSITLLLTCLVDTIYFKRLSTNA